VGTEAGGIEKRHADMIMISGIMMAEGHLMTVAVLGMKSTVVGFCNNDARAMLQSLDGRGNGKRQGNDQARAKCPDPCPSC
jgi:hypothetical protein